MIVVPLLLGALWASSPSVGVDAGTRVSTPARVDASAVKKAAAAARAGDFTKVRPLVLSHPAVNVHELLFTVFKQAIDEQDADKKYFLEKLAAYNEAADALSDYLDELAGFLSELGRASQPAGPKKTLVEVEPGIHVLVSEGDRAWTRKEIEAEIAEVRRQKRELARSKAATLKAAKAAGVTSREIARASELWKRLGAAAEDDDDDDRP